MNKTFNSVLAGMLCLGLTAPISAAPVTAVFDSTIDLSGIGGASDAAYKIQFTYDLATPDQFPGDPNDGAYAITSGTALIGNDNLSFAAGGIRIFNDVPFTPQAFDQFQFNAYTITGTVLGLPLLNIRFNLFDLDGSIFANDTLPQDFSFVSGIDTGTRFIRDTSMPSGPFTAATFGRVSDGQFFTFDFVNGNTGPSTSVSEPSIFALLGLGLAGLIGFGREKNIHA